MYYTLAKKKKKTAEVLSFRVKSYVTHFERKTFWN